MPEDKKDTLTKALASLEIIIATSLSATATKTALDIAELVNSLTLSGMSNESIKATLLTDLKSGGRIFGTYRNAIKGTTESAIHLASSEATRSVFENRGVKEYVWMTGGGNTCPDCLPRHGQVQTWEQWQIAGAPRSGFSVCRHHCGCTLIPSTYKGEQINEPLYRTKRIKELRKKYAESR